MNPSLSIIVTTYNSVPFIADAVRTVRNQNLPDAEVLFVDDGSTDGSGDLILKEMPEARLIRQENQGPSGARNTGLRESTGESIVFLDADDLWPEGTLRKRLAALEQNPEADAVLMNTQAVRMRNDGSMEPWGEAWCSPCFGAGLYRRRMFEKVGPLATDLRYAEDIDWFWRARELGVPIHLMPETGLLGRKHGASTTAGQDWQKQRLSAVIQRSLARRRAAGIPGALPLLKPHED